jgi:Flp pilus assembly pilin Flp
MQTLLLKLQFKIEELTERQEGQDMVEYALVVGLIAFGAASASKFLAAGLAGTFSNISTTLSSYVS